MKIIILIALCILLSSCTIVRGSFMPFTNTPTVQKTDGNLVMTTKDLDRPYTEVGIITVRGNSWAEKRGALSEKMRELGLQAGADAIIKIQCGSSTSVAGSFNQGSGVIVPVRRNECQGVAVIFK